MIYTKSLVWRAIYTVLPSYEIVVKDGLNLNLSSSLKDAAIECFTYKLEHTRYIGLIRIALRELCEDGLIEFGDRDFV